MKPGPPLVLRASVEPVSSSVGDPVSLAVRLFNTGETEISVSRRLLLNHPDAPAGYGEVFVETDGPPRYRNVRRFHVRAGAATDADFVTLQPGAHVGREYMLTDYESLHVPGRYSLVVGYRHAPPTGEHRVVRSVPTLLERVPAV